MTIIHVIDSTKLFLCFLKNVSTNIHVGCLVNKQISFLSEILNCFCDGECEGWLTASMCDCTGFKINGHLNSSL